MEVLIKHKEENMMKKRIMMLAAMGILILAFTACGKNNVNVSDGRSGQSEEQTEISTEEKAGQSQEAENTEPEENIAKTDAQADRNENSNILIAYFSRVGNTDFPADVDAVSSASLVRKDGELYGNTQYIASLIQQSTGGDLFLIETAEKYPVEYDETDEQGRSENRDRTRPELASHVENLDSYDIVFLGFPNWYYDMPMVLYTFLEEHDLSGKTVIPFVTSGGGGFSDAISEIQNLQQGAEVLSDGFQASHSRIDDVTFQDVQEWIDGLSLSNK